MYKNVPDQRVFIAAISISDGSPKTSGVDFYLTQDNGSQAAVNSATHVGNGQWRIDLTQAETNADVIGICWAGTNVVPGNITLYPVAKKTQDYQTELSRLDAAITSRLAAADVPDHFSSLAITETTGKVTVDNVDDCKADVSGLATSAEIAACQTTAEAIKTQTDKMDFTGGGSMLKSESTNMRGTDGAYTGTPPTTGEIAAALKASTGWTAGNTMTLAEVVKILAAWSAGKWRDKDGAAGTYQVLDPDDGTTVICEITPSETTPHKTVTIL